MAIAERREVRFLLAERSPVWGALALGVREVSGLERAWMAIREPRVARIIFTIGYLIALLIGIFTLAWPPQTVLKVVGQPLATIWACFILGGGAIGLATIHTRLWNVERLAIYAIMTGMLMYAVIIIYIQSVGEGNRWTQLGFVIFSALVPALRLSHIWKYDIEPRGQ